MPSSPRIRRYPGGPFSVPGYPRRPAARLSGGIFTAGIFLAGILIAGRRPGVPGRWARGIHNRLREGPSWLWTESQKSTSPATGVRN